MCNLRGKILAMLFFALFFELHTRILKVTYFIIPVFEERNHLREQTCSISFFYLPSHPHPMWRYQSCHVSRASPIALAIVTVNCSPFTYKTFSLCLYSFIVYIICDNIFTIDPPNPSMPQPSMGQPN